MRRNSYLLAMALLSILTFPCPCNAQGIGAFGRPGEMYRAEENVTVTFNPALPLSDGVVDEIIRSKDVAGAAASELSGEPVRLNLDGNIQQWVVEKNVNKSFYAGAGQLRPGGATREQLHLKIRVLVRGESSFDEAEKYARLVASRLDVVLREMSRREFERKLDQLNAAAREAKTNVEVARQELVETQAQLQQESSTLSTTTLQELVGDLAKQQQALEVELAGMKGRSEALQTEVAKTAARVENEPVEDEVVKYLKHIVELRNHQLQTVRELYKQGGGASFLDMTKAEEQVALAQVELAQAKRATSRSSGEHLEKLTADLSQIAINIAENEAKLRYVQRSLREHEQMLKQEAKARPLRQQLEKQTAALVRLQAQADHEAGRVRQLESTFRPTRVEVFELTPNGEKAADAEKAKP